MRVGLTCPGWPPSSCTNGIVTYVSMIAQGLDACGVHPHILTDRVEGVGPDNIQVSDIGVLRSDPSLMRRRWKRFFGMSRRQRDMGVALAQALDKVLRLHPCDVLEMEETWGWSAEIARHLEIPVIVRLHGPWFLNGAAWGRNRERDFQLRVKREGDALTQVAGVTSPSHDVLEQTRRYYGLALPAARVVPNPIMLPEPSSCWRVDHAMVGTILFVGRFDRLKGGDVLLRAFAEVLRTHPTAKLIFAGPSDGFQDEQSRKWSLADYLCEHFAPEVRAGVDVLGQVPPEAVLQLRRQAAVTVVTSRTENFPYVVLEAASVGSPIVATRVGGIPEMVMDGTEGLLFENENVEHLASQIRVFLDNVDFARSCGEAARRRCERDFVTDRVAESASAFYREICN